MTICDNLRYVITTIYGG